MGGIGSGAQKAPAVLIKEAKETDAKNLPLYFIRLSEMALSGDKEALIYLINRHLGKPKEHTDITTDGEQLGTGLVRELFTMLTQMKRELDTEPIKLIEVSDATIEEEGQREETTREAN